MKRLLIGISGASGAPLAVTLLEELKQIPEIESHVILSECGALTLSKSYKLKKHIPNEEKDMFLLEDTQEAIIPKTV